MEVILDKRIRIDAPAAQAWTVLGDVRAVAGCMPGAQITEQLDDTHFKGTVRSKVGPATMSFGGDIELLARDEPAQSIAILGRGADKAGSSASMRLDARIEAGHAEGDSVLVGHATVTVTGKIAQFGSRLLVPVADAMLAQFADNFAGAAKALGPDPADAGDNVPGDATVVREAPAPVSTPPRELDALSLAWIVLRRWLRGLLGRGES